MTYLAKFFEHVAEYLNAGVLVGRRKRVNFSSEFTLIDNPAINAVDVFTTGGSPIAVPNTRHVIAGQGLAGGGDLTADRTFNIVAANPSIVVNTDNVSIGALQNDGMHGNLGGGALHQVAVPGGANGFLSGVWATYLDEATMDPLAGRLALRGPAAECGFGYVFTGNLGTAAALGQYRGQNNSILLAAYSSTVPNYIEAVATDGADNVLLGPDALGGTILRTTTTILAKVAGTTVLTLAAAIQTFATKVRATSFQTDADANVAADGALRVPLATTIAAARATSGANLTAVATNGSNEVLLGQTEASTIGSTTIRTRAGSSIALNVGLTNAANINTLVDLNLRARLPASSPTAVREFGADNTTGRILMFVDGASRSGGILPTVSSVQTSAFTAAWDTTYRVDPTSGPFTATLTTAVGNTGRCVTFVFSSDSSNAVTIDGAGAETINGASAVILAEPRGVLVVQSDGTNVVIVTRPQGVTLDWGAGGVGNTATPRYLRNGYEGGTAPTSIYVFRMPRARTVSRITYSCGAAGTGTGSLTFTLFRRVAGSPVTTALAVTVLVTATTGEATLTTPIALAADDEIGIQATQTGTVTASPTDVAVAIG